MSDQPKKQELVNLEMAERFLHRALKAEAELDTLRSDNEAKAARITELEALIPGFVYGKSMLVPIGSAGDLVAMNNRAQSAEAKLKSVEGLLEEKLTVEYAEHPDTEVKLAFYWADPVDALLARIREAIK